MARPRSEEAHRKVLEAALDLMAKHGIEGTSIDAIVRASGVSKATVYKHWESKESLYVEAISTLHGETPIFNSGNPRADITAFLQYMATRRKPKNFVRIWPRIVGYASQNPAFAKAWHAHATEPGRAQLSRLLQRAISQGELRSDIDLDLAMDLLIGPVLHRRFLNEAVPPDVPERVVDAFWQAHATTRLRKVGT